MKSKGSRGATSSGVVSRTQAARLKAVMSGVSFPALPSSGAAASRSPAAAGTYASYADVAKGRATELSQRASFVGNYMAMVADPFPKENARRYPDETIVPTGLTHLTSSETYTATAEGTVFTSLRWKLLDAATGYPPIAVPKPLSAGGVAVVDYGDPQTAWTNLASVDRSLALAIRTRLVGLPTATFLPSGTLYFLQVQRDEYAGVLAALQASGESVAIQAVTAGKGFSMTVNELSKSDGVIVSYLPQGPMSFVFSDTGSGAPALAGSAGFPSQVLSANGFVLVVGFGMNEGLNLRFDYAHHVEYVPRYAAAGLISTSVEPPSAPERDSIARASQLVQASRAGTTSIGENPTATAGGIRSVLGGIARAAVGMIPGASAFARAGAAMARGMGGPAWLTSALDQLS